MPSPFSRSSSSNISAAVTVSRLPGRLVAHDQPRIGRERARDRDPLLLPAGELRRQMIELVAEPDQLEVVPRPLEPLALRAAAEEVERQHRVLERRQRRQQLEELEDDPDVRAPPHRQLLLAHLVEALAVEGDRAGRRPVDPRDHVQDRRLAAPRRPDHRHHLAGGDREIDAAQRAIVDLAHPVDLLDAGELDQRLFAGTRVLGPVSRSGSACTLDAVRRFTSPPEADVPTHQSHGLAHQPDGRSDDSQRKQDRTRICQSNGLLENSNGNTRQTWTSTTSPIPFVTRSPTASPTARRSRDRRCWRSRRPPATG